MRWDGSQAISRLNDAYTDVSRDRVIVEDLTDVDLDVAQPMLAPHARTTRNA